jgi:predicted RNase H-like HicB family nuclease
MSEENIEEYMALPYSISVVPDVCTDGTQCYVASHPELPGCMSHGDTIEEATHNLHAMRRLYIRSLLKRNLPVPFPVAAQSVEWLVQTTDQPSVRNKSTFTTRVLDQQGVQWGQVIVAG